jgi:hypothetical protein
MVGRVGICLYAPRGSIGGFRLYKPLAPTKEMLKMGIDEYTPKYQAILDQLDPQKVWDDLHLLANPHAGSVRALCTIEPILLCYETPPFTRSNFCHRRQAALWLEQRLGVSIPELGFEGQAIDVQRPTPLF